MVFIQISGKGLDRLSKAFVNTAKKIDTMHYYLATRVGFTPMKLKKNCGLLLKRELKMLPSGMVMKLMK